MDPSPGSPGVPGGGEPQAGRGSGPERSAASGGRPARRRPSWDEYFLDMAALVAGRSTCPRRHVGAVLVRDRRVVSTGYNGSIRGEPHCDEVGCLLVDGHCRRTVHAELNALLQCALHGVTSAGTTLYTTDFPCLDCAKALVQAGVRRIVFRSDYPDRHSAALLDAGGMEVFRAVDRPGGVALVREA